MLSPTAAIPGTTSLSLGVSEKKAKRKHMPTAIAAYFMYCLFDIWGYAVLALIMVGDVGAGC